eukprot:gene3708-4272_t
MITTVVVVALLATIVPLTSGQYATDVCQQFTTGHEVITYKIDSLDEADYPPYICWHIKPRVSSIAFIPRTIDLNIISANLTGANGTITIYAGGLRGGPILGEYNDILEPTSNVSTALGEMIVFMTYGYIDPFQFTVQYTSDLEDTYIKPSILMLVTVVVAFAVPALLVGCISCCTRKNKEKLKTRQTIMFWIGTLLGVVLMILLLSRKLIK